MIGRTGRDRGVNDAFICSWSGGKDSALAFHRAVAMGRHPRRLLTMMLPDAGRTRSHGLSAQVIQSQADALGVVVDYVPCSWDSYEAEFGGALRRAVQCDIRSVVFGDIDFQANREWAFRLAKEQGLEPFEPLWGVDRRELLEEFFTLGFKARIVAIRDGMLPREFLGAELTRELLMEFVSLEVDLAGEGGEYHTVVYDGPTFRRAVDLIPTGNVYGDGYWFQDFTERRFDAQQDGSLPSTRREPISTQVRA